MACPYKTDRGCSRTGWTNLQAFCIDNYERCVYIADTEVRDIRYQMDQEEKARNRAEAAAKRSAQQQAQRQAELQLEADRLESERIRQENQQRQAALEEARAAAKAMGMRLDHDVKYAKIRNRFICFWVAFFLLFRFVIPGHSFFSIGKYAGDFPGLLEALGLSLPMVLMTIGVKAYGKDEFFGKCFRGSAFLRTYLATLVPCLVGLGAVWFVFLYALKLTVGPGPILLSYLIYLLVCIVAWALNHTSLKKLWEGGLGYYLTQGKS